MVSSRSPASARRVAARIPHVPIRTCISCRRQAAKTSLLRVTAHGGTVEVGRRAPGRGAYLCPDERCLTGALRAGAASLARALRCRPGQIEVDEEQLAAAVAAVASGEPRREGVST